MTTNTTTPPVKAPLMSDKVYNLVKDIVTMYLPAIAVFYSSLAIVWGWGYVDAVVATIGAIATFLGVFIKVTSSRHANQPIAYDGQLKVNMTDPTVDNYRLELNQAWDELSKKDEVRIKVNDESDPFQKDVAPLN